MRRGASGASGRVTTKPSIRSRGALYKAGAYALKVVRLAPGGLSRSLWANPRTGWIEAIPRHTEIPNNLARKICRNLSIPEIGSRRNSRTERDP